MQKLCMFLICLPLYAYKLGIENMSQELLAALKSESVGLITNQTGVDSVGHRSIDILLQNGVPVTKIYVPEHGLDGKALAGQDIFNQKDSKTGLPVISLYAHGAGKIDRHAFDTVSLLAIDLQDVGMRHYTYISTLYMVMEECARVRKPIIVFDRPNLLGAVMEGPICMPQLRSFIGIASIPLRHGMTIGELAQLFNATCFAGKTALQVVPLEGYRREDICNLLAPLSPNISSMAAVQGYSFLGLVGEISPFHVGVGSGDAFCIVTLPQDCGVTQEAWKSLRTMLEPHGIISKPFSCFHEQKKKQYEGLKCTFDDMNTVSGFKAFMSILAWVKDRKVPVTFAPTFDKAVGTSDVRSWYHSDESYDAIIHSTKQRGQEFLDLNQNFLLYQPYPKVVRADTIFNKIRA